MKESIFKINTTGVNAEEIVSNIRKTVADKMRKGIYSDPRVARAESMNLENLSNEEEFHAFYLECLRDVVSVDINDFDIIEQRIRFSGMFVLLKKTIWKFLRFYTYRLWSQQNLINGLMLSAIERTERQNRDRVKTLEARINKLETTIGIQNSSECPPKNP